jgi:peptide/nickel transport system substrate-binding protein
MYIDPQSIKKLDDKTVTMNTNIPMGGAFLKTLCHTWASVLNKEAVENAGKDYGVRPIGTGRFKLGSWDFGDRTVFVRFDDYHGSTAPLEKMIVRTIIEASSRTIELESGAVDIIEFPALADIPRLEASGFKIVQKPSVRNYFIGFDVTKPPYNDVRVRQAMSMAINRRGIAKAVFRDYCKVSKGVVTSAVMPEKYDSSPELPYDLEKAKQLLKEAGFPNGFKGTMLASDRTEVTSAAVVLQDNFRRVGVEMEIKVIEWGAFLDFVRHPGHDPWISWWWGGTPAADPFFLMTTQFHSSLIGTTNRYIFNNETVDKLLDKGSSLPEGPERKAVYNELWDIMNEQMAMVPLVEPYNMFAMDPNLEGAKFASGSISYYGNAYFKK